MLLGYNTNGLAHHDLLDAVRLLADIGYRSVAITIDHGALSPCADWRAQLSDLKKLLRQLGMRSVIETGARFLLDPRRKHEPTLVSPDAAERARRVDFYRHAMRCAAELESDCVSLWSGVVHDGAPPDVARARLTTGLQEVLDAAEAAGVVIGFEPEPGMLVDSTSAWADLLARIDSPRLKLTLDVGHLHCQREWPLEEYIRRWADRLVNVHLEDMRGGCHEHLMFGEGEIAFPSVVQTLADVGYAGGVHVELSRHSHMGPAATRQAFEFLEPLLNRQAL